MKQGWECLKCGAVMSPYEKVCINCQGNLLSISTWPDKIYPTGPIVTHYATPIPFPGAHIWTSQKEK